MSAQPDWIDVTGIMVTALTPMVPMNAYVPLKAMDLPALQNLQSVCRVMLVIYPEEDTAMVRNEVL